MSSSFSFLILGIYLIGTSAVPMVLRTERKDKSQKDRGFSMSRVSSSVPTPLPHTYSELLDLCCDGCKQRLELALDDTYPGGWREFTIYGCVGVFHACSNDCEKRVKVEWQKTDCK